MRFDRSAILASKKNFEDSKIGVTTKKRTTSPTNSLLLLPAMISSTTMTIRRILLVAFLSAIVIATETRASSAFVMAPSSRANQPLVRKTDFANQNQFRGGATKVSSQDEELQDFGGAVTGLFGNLRIPASLLAGASLGSAFALPMLDTDGAKIGMAKRLYAFSMVTTLGSMLLVVIITTIVMNDIALRPKRLSKTSAEYIEENYGCEWMIVRSHFFYGSFAFLGGCAFRAYISIACPVIGKGVLGILASLSMMCMSYLVENAAGQRLGAQQLQDRFGRFLKSIGKRAKENVWFGAGAITWIWAVAYLTYKLPHMYTYLVNM